MDLGEISAFVATDSMILLLCRLLIGILTSLLLALLKIASWYANIQYCITLNWIQIVCKEQPFVLRYSNTILRIRFEIYIVLGRNYILLDFSKIIIDLNH